MDQSDLTGTFLRKAKFNEAFLHNVNLSGSDLDQASFSRSTFSETTLEDTLSLQGTDLRGVKGLTKEQLEACKARGAIIDDPTVSSSQSPVAPPPPTQSNDVQAPSTPSAQGSVLTPATEESNAPSSKLDSES